MIFVLFPCKNKSLKIFADPKKYPDVSGNKTVFWGLIKIQTSIVLRKKTKLLRCTDDGQ